MPPVMIVVALLACSDALLLEVLGGTRVVGDCRVGCGLCQVELGVLGMRVGLGLGALEDGLRELVDGAR